jgi:excisionase family DNA binding protein
MYNENDILQQLHVIRKELAELKVTQKEVLNFDEACEYLSISASHLYKLTSTHQIPCYQPNGKKLYFRRCEVDEWLLRNRKAATNEIEKMASDYVMLNSRKGGGL